MRRGTCVKCGSPTVFAAVDGISPGGGSDWVVVVASSGAMVRRQVISVTTYACSACGYVENYADPATLGGAVGSWNPIKPGT